ncbi:MAG: hypothetical protein M0Z41_00860 [Peptococcaceae bacterium]|jgi:hypothetical protein|nr:hypothetical protein [Peptococcaceae bacterium]
MDPCLEIQMYWVEIWDNEAEQPKTPVETRIFMSLRGARRHVDSLLRNHKKAGHGYTCLVIDRYDNVYEGGAI